MKSSERFSITKIYIDRNSVNSQITKNTLSLLPETPYEIVDKLEKKGINLSDSKKILYLKENKSNFFKKCPGTPNYICCLYKVLHLAENCPMDCSYCILQAYFKNPYLTIFTNTDKMLNEISEADKKGVIYRVGTGEWTDSFALEPFGNWNQLLIPFWGELNNLFLELKSKDNNLDFLKYSKVHKRKVIISFSLNSSKIQQSEELNTTTIEERIKIAKKAYEQGFINSFHFDPIIYYNGYQKDYEDSINMLFDNIPENNICWISMGTLRFIPALKDIAIKRFPNSNIYFQEFHTGIDSKYRYFIKKRIDIYRDIVKAIRKRSLNVPLYFCMENRKVWESVFGVAPKNSKSLSNYLDESILKVSKNY